MVADSLIFRPRELMHSAPRQLRRSFSSSTPKFAREQCSRSVPASLAQFLMICCGDNLAGGRAALQQSSHAAAVNIPVFSFYDFNRKKL